MTAVTLPHPDRPVASVILVTYGGWELTRRTLETLVANTDPPFEVIVVDNPTGEEDVAANLRRDVEGAEVILNDHNEGFGPAANRGAERARAEYVVFLNTDALVAPGWLEPLVETLEEDRWAGAAVPRFLNEDGTVQEAGGLLFRDGSTLMYGYGADPGDPAFRFRRYTDYGSAACLLVRREAFRQVGGFDPAYVPAYCEDVDLQLKLREERGLRAVFQPRSEVTHIRFGSTGLNEEVAQRLVAQHTTILRGRWSHVLAHHPPRPEGPHHERRVLTARDADAMDRILVLAEDALPEDLLSALGRRNPTARVTFMSTRRRPTAKEVDRLLTSGVEVPPFADAPGWIRSRRFSLTAAFCPEGYPSPPVAQALMEAQPQAPLITMGAGGPSSGLVEDLLDQLTDVGILPDRIFRN
jgi:O-antigen biosynthesis protein